MHPNGHTQPFSSSSSSIRTKGCQQINTWSISFYSSTLLITVFCSTIYPCQPRRFKYGLSVFLFLWSTKTGYTNTVLLSCDLFFICSGLIRNIPEAKCTKASLWKTRYSRSRHWKEHCGGYCWLCFYYYATQNHKCHNLNYLCAQHDNCHHLTNQTSSICLIHGILDRKIDFQDGQLY